MNDQADEGYVYLIPEIIEDRIQISGVFSQPTSTSTVGYGVNLSFPELHIYRTLRSRELSLLRGKVEAVLELWEKKCLQYLQYQTDRYRAGAVDQLNRDTDKRLRLLRNILVDALDNTPSADWLRIECRGVFSVTPKELYGIPDIPAYILMDEDGRPADVLRLDQVRKPDIEKTKKQFGAITKVFSPSKVREAVDQELERWSKKRSDIGVANAERRATLRQAQDIYDASKSMFKAGRESDQSILKNIKTNYERLATTVLNSDFATCAVEEHCDLIMMAIKYPDEICSNWLMNYVPERKVLHLDLDLPAIDQLRLPKAWEYSTSSAEVVEIKLSKREVAELCDLVCYQMLLRTMRDLFVADEARAIETIICNGQVAFQGSDSDEWSSRVVASVSADREELLQLDFVAESPSALFEQLGGITAGAPHLAMPVQPMG